MGHPRAACDCWVASSSAVSALPLLQIRIQLHKPPPKAHLHARPCHIKSLTANLVAFVWQPAGVLPESAAWRHVRSMAIRLVPLSDPWALRSMQICVRSLDELPNFARDLIDLLSEDARLAMA